VVIAVAIDESAGEVRPWTAEVTFPVLIDPNHVLTELFAISNVPTVIWIDEDNHIVRPNGVAFGTNMFQEFTGVDALPHFDALRRWVRSGVLPITPEEARTAVGDLSDDEMAARLHFRIAAEARRQGRIEVAQRHFDLAAGLAPDDFTIRRATMPLVGEDPFGQDFMALYANWMEAGSPYHGLPPTS
jgi:hypothetical protein